MRVSSPILHPYADGLVVATKVGVTRPSPGEWVPLGRPEYLRRLKVERIGLLQLHRVDPQVPFADQIGALRQLLGAGGVAHIGLSEVDVVRLKAAAAPDGPIAAVAVELGITPAQASLAWLLRRSPVILPIPGTRPVAHLAENVAAGEVALTDGQFARLSAVGA
ncbi:aryl-alcohol dehydrogenase-like predicted oxidoreductase [Phytomonospora endophytica]|uniref:Aryl-alcohol dehydrogenase-like predicted oxidoreductase n=1 Tax=Phytomonospora endophytica TaxID=714109 RepID=A0A841FSQ2_9ACTN|nr:aldo/keto reductase [Phytomonospora endophytica]MBB6039066.1 aryl-alcohol dehydrogenase-like predicted oxidoreductase [Phytomonospora endophytica]GIG71495.1 oxidoreductase [Phytomonospora endophytica]